MFILTKDVDSAVVYPYIGIWMPSVTTSLDIKYQAESLISLSGDLASVKFSVSTDGCSSSGELIHTFLYTGEGSPLAEAEISLKASLEN